MQNATMQSHGSAGASPSQGDASLGPPSTSSVTPKHNTRRPTLTACLNGGWGQIGSAGASPSRGGPGEVAGASPSQGACALRGEDFAIAADRVTVRPQV